MNAPLSVPTTLTCPLRLALPKGRMASGVERLLAEAGISMSTTARAYRPAISLAGVEVKLLKPQSVVEMLAEGVRDVGFCGADWVAELGADVVELLDTGLDPVRLVAAAPPGLLDEGRLPRRDLRVATEYPALTERWARQRSLSARVLRAWGATEVLPPEDADLIVDNTATGATLAANGLVVVDELMRSSTRLYASRAAWGDPRRRARIEELVLLTRSVLEARARVLLEINVSGERLADVVARLPCMREPTVAPLAGEGGFAVKAAVPRAALTALIPELLALGGTDVVVTTPTQIIA